MTIPRRHCNGCRRVPDIYVVVIDVLHLACFLLLFEGNDFGAHGYHINLPPHDFFPSPDFDDGPGRRYHDGYDQDDFRGNPEDWFYPPYEDTYQEPQRQPHPFHRNPIPHPPFPPPPPRGYYTHPRFLEPPPPFVILNETPETHQSPIVTTTASRSPILESAVYHEPENNNNHNQRGQNTKQSPPQSIWKTSAPVLVQSLALQTFAFDTPSIERVQVLLKPGQRHGRKRSRSNPLQARIDVWHGPDSTPQNVAIFLEDDDDEEEDDHEDEMVFSDGTGYHTNDDETTNFSAIIETPQGYNTIAVRNTAPDFDLLACVEGEESEGSTSNGNSGSPHYHLGGDPTGYYYAETRGNLRKPSRDTQNVGENERNPESIDAITSNCGPLQSVIELFMATSTPQILEGTRGGPSTSLPDVNQLSSRTDVHTETLAQNVVSVQVLLRTDYMRPLQARVELILKEHGQTHADSGRVLKRTIVEVFSEDGMHRPFFALLETPRKRNRRTTASSDQNNGGNAKQYSVSLRVINLSGAEFPIVASIEPCVVDAQNEEQKEEKASHANNGVGENAEHAQQYSGQHNYEFKDGADCEYIDDDIFEEDWWERSVENSHFGGGSQFDMRTNSTILDAEIL